MKKLLFLTSLFFFSCAETPQEITLELEKLKLERKYASTSLMDLKQQVDNLESQKKYADSVIELSKVLQSKNPKYILTLHYEATSMSLDINEHIKNSANAFDFEIPVDAEYYHQVNVGQTLVDEFKRGSAFVNGKFGNSEITVTNKRIVK
jgi:hypothetical protein